jgi:MinD-like ATPase involved in chromosome partitioning or flagellar assembly
VARQFLSVSVYDAGHLPLDEQVPAAVRRRTPFVLASPRSPASQAIAQLAVRLARGAAASAAPAAGGGFFHRMSRWFRK